MTGNYEHYLFNFLLFFFFLPGKSNFNLLSNVFFFFFFLWDLFLVNELCQCSVGAEFKLFCSGMMLTISLTKWQKSSSGLWASPSPLAEGSSWHSGALPLFSAPSHGSTKGSCENPRLGKERLYCSHIPLGRWYSSFTESLNFLGWEGTYKELPSPALQWLTHNQQPTLVIIPQKSHHSGCWSRLGLRSIFVFPRSCPGNGPWWAFTDPSGLGAHRDEAAGKPEWDGFSSSWAQQECQCVSAAPWEGKFAHTSSRAAAELDVVIKHLLNRKRVASSNCLVWPWTSSLLWRQVTIKTW